MTAVATTVLDLLAKGLSHGEVKAETTAKHNMADSESLDEFIVGTENLKPEEKERLRKLIIEG